MPRISKTETTDAEQHPGFIGLDADNVQKGSAGIKEGRLVETVSCTPVKNAAVAFLHSHHRWWKKAGEKMRKEKGGRREADAQTSSLGGRSGRDIVAGGNPPLASLTFSSAASPYQSPRLYSVEGIPLRSALFTTSPLLHHVPAYPLIFPANCQHYYFHRGRCRNRKRHFPCNLYNSRPTEGFPSRFPIVCLSLPSYSTHGTCGIMPRVYSSTFKAHIGK